MSPEELIAKLYAANLAYAKGMPFMTDSEYDKLWKQLHTYDPENKVLYHTAYNPNIPYDMREHKYQLYGTNKAFNTDDLKPFLQRFGSETLILEPKYDGCAAILYLGRDDHDDKLILEGNGITGRDISHHLAKIWTGFEPRYMESVELVIPIAGWESKFGSNPRNTVAGWLARKELPYQNLIQMVSHNNGELKHEYLFDGDYEALTELLLTLYSNWSKQYPLDGVMIKVLDETKRIIAHHNGTSYNWSIAWKPPIQTKETTVTDIEWNVSRTGRVIPTVIYEPIELCGTRNSRVTGNNAAWVINRDIEIGNFIIVGKAGEIIPKIIETKIHPDNYNSETFVPLLCPVCNSPLSWQGVDLICDAPNCIAQLTKRIDYFYSDKGMEVKTIGEYRISDLLQNYHIKAVLAERIWALLDPIHYGIYDDIFKIWGNKITHNYMESLHQVKGKKNASHFISGLGYEGLAYKTTIKLLNYIKTGVVKSHVGKKAQANFILAFAKYQQAEAEMQNFPFDFIPAPSKVVYCITGTLSAPRSDMTKFLEGQGWEFSNQVSKFTDYLIQGDEPGRTKITKANELGVPIISESEIYNILTKEPNS